ncbi:hypothetical protein BH11PSE13_BH11PSE13_22880 [soil metagenome]
MNGAAMNATLLGVISIAQIVDAVIVVTALEGIALVVWHRRTGAGVAPRDFAANLVSGLCLMLALHAALRDLGAAWIALFLLAAGIAHAADLWRRWVRRPSDGRRPNERSAPSRP